jgi:hypothetical protein
MTTSVSVECRFCGDRVAPDDLLHLLRCDGRQGAREAALETIPNRLLISGLSPATYGTSAAAARSSTDGDRARQREQVYRTIQAAGPAGCTDDEVEARLGLQGHSVCPRRIELWRARLVTEQLTDDGRPVRRRTRSGRSAVVWIART